VNYVVGAETIPDASLYPSALHGDLLLALTMADHERHGMCLITPEFVQFLALERLEMNREYPIPLMELGFSVL
jgi:hypothetical protein